MFKNSNIFRCDNSLKVWPKNIGPNVFKCQIGQECDPERLERMAKNEDTGEKGSASAYNPRNLGDGNSEDQEDRQSISVANNGDSRYCCFEDGFDVCNLCAEEVLNSKAPMTASTMNNTGDSTFDTRFLMLRLGLTARMKIFFQRSF